MIVTLVLLQRTEVVEGFMLTNFETLEAGEEHQLDSHQWVLQHAGITQQQVLRIGRAAEFFERLLAPIMQERQQLQREIAAQREQILQDSRSSSGSNSSIDGRGHKQSMAKREAMLVRMSSLMGKEYLVRLAASCAVCGPLTYAQLANLVVQMTPRPVSLQLLGKLLLQQYQQQQQAQQQSAAAVRRKKK